MNESEKRHLIIAGTTKSGTTSLFGYLSDHPNVCASAIKETRYFLDQNYPLHSMYRYHKDAIACYWRLYTPRAGETLLVEATPDYLYSQVTPELIKQHMPDAKLVFILRNPIERVISWYQFASQNGKFIRDTSLSEYIVQQLVQEESSTDLPQWQRAVEQGRYAYYLDPFISTFGHENCLLLDFAELEERPEEVMQVVCDFAGITSDYFQTYEFKVLNQTGATRWVGLHRQYLGLRYRLRHYLFHYPLIFNLFRAVKGVIEPVYFALNLKSKKSLEVSQEVREDLEKYYCEDTRLFRQMCAHNAAIHRGGTQ